MIYRPVHEITGFDDILLIGFQSGDSWIFRYNNTLKNLVCVLKEKTSEHEDKLRTIDCLPSKGLFISGSEDGITKIWNI